MVSEYERAANCAAVSIEGGGIVNRLHAMVGLALLGWTAPARAGMILQHLADDNAASSFIQNISFVAEGRIGNNAANGTHELGLGASTSSFAQTAHSSWANAAASSFTLSFTPADGLARFTVGTQTLQFAPLSGADDLFLRTRASRSNSGLRLQNLTLDGVPVSDSSWAVNPGSGIDILWIRNAGLSDGFTLSGEVLMSWNQRPNNSQLAFQISAGNAVPQPATWSLLAVGGALAYQAGRRRMA